MHAACRVNMTAACMFQEQQLPAIPQITSLFCFRYLIQYSVSDSSGVAAVPLAISITVVEVALVTGSFLFIGQAHSPAEAQQHTVQLYTSGTAPNSALTADIAAVYQTWLASNVSAYVSQMTTALGASTAVVAAVNILELGLFSSVQVSDVTVLNATIDQAVTADLNINSTEAVQNYCYNVTLQVTVLTADMLLSVFVDVLNGTTQRRHLMSSSDWQSRAVDHSMLTVSTHAPARPDHAAVSSHLSGTLPAVPFSNATVSKLVPVTMLKPLQHEQDLTGDLAASSQSCSSAAAVQEADDSARLLSLQAQMHVPTLAKAVGVLPASGDSLLPMYQLINQAQAHARALQSTASASAFPLVSLLTFKVDLTLAAFGGTSGCNADSVAALFYDDAEVPDSLEDLCSTDGNTADLSLNRALHLSANGSVPLLQVCNATVVCLGLSLAGLRLLCIALCAQCAALNSTV